jgi:dTDP-glucose pyrophosphorylase
VIDSPIDVSSRADRITALIPAAGAVPAAIYGVSMAKSPAMIPLAGRPVIQWTMDYLSTVGIKRYRIAVPNRGLFLEEFVDCVFGKECDVEFLVPSVDGGVGLTLHELASGVRTPATLVVLGDTHFEFADVSILDENEPFVLVDEVEESYRWCTAEIDADGWISALHDKEPGLPAPLSALIGVYFFPNTQIVARASDEAVVASPGHTELADILGRVSSRSRIRAVRAGKWLDCGNPDRQAASQRALLEQRAFNEISVDATFGTLTKRSRRVDKFIDEINYLRLLPPELAILFPRVVSYSTDWQQPELTMEFFGYPTLSELFVFDDLDTGIWRGVFEHIYEILDRGFMAYRRPLAEGAIEAMYLGKVRSRLAEINGPPELAKLVGNDGPIVVNGEELANLPSLWPLLEERVTSLADSAVGSIIHGDLCFSNVLYDVRTRTGRFVDPRGSFDQAGTFGDLRYDVAKLYHSVHGFYDFITADLFRITTDGNQVELDIRTRPQHGLIRQEFESVFFEPFDHGEILLITALIFLSLPALHVERAERQLALYVRGLQLVHEALHRM